MAAAKILRQPTQKLVQALLERPELSAELARLDGGEWKALVTEVGLEDSGELLALASPEQLLELIDEDLWRPTERGVEQRGEELDAERFVTLLEVLAEAGSETLASKLGGLSEDFLHLALSRLVWVLPTDFVQGQVEAGDGEQLEKKLEALVAIELDDYLLLWRGGDGSDVVLDVFTTWNERDPEFLGRLLARLSAAALSQLDEPDDLIDALDALEEIQEDAEAEREERRAAGGYVSLNDARAFLRLPPLAEPGAEDAISRAYFRRLERPRTTARASGPRVSAAPELGELLRRAAPKNRQLRAPDRPLKRALALVQNQDPGVHARCLEEIAFLVNVVTSQLLAQGEGKTAADAFAFVAERLERASGESPPNDERLAESLLRWRPIGLFRRVV